MADTAFKPVLALTRGDVDCFMTLLCQISGTMIGVISALQIVLVAPFLAGASSDDILAMKRLADDIIFGRVTSGMCVTMIFGNVYYAFMAYRMMRRERRSDVACLPYGINTPAAFAFVFNIVAKAASRAASEGQGWEEGVMYAWRVGCVANLVAGIIGTLCGFAGPAIVRLAPKASLLIALAGVGFTWLGVNQVVICFQAGYAGLLPLGVSLVCFFSGVRTSPLPAAVVVMLVGGLAGWCSAQGWPEGEAVKLGGTAEAVSLSLDQFGFYPPTFLDAASFAAIPSVIADNLSIILPVSLTGAVNTLLSVYASHDAGDVFPIRECMVVDGLTTVVAALFGSPLGTCVYIGHPQFKAQGGRMGYSFMNAFVFCALAATGVFSVVNAVLPPYAIAPIILFVGLAINQDAFGCTPEKHYPAAILGLFPPLAEWILSLWPHGSEPPRHLAALAHGALLTGVLWTGLGVFIITRKFQQASLWSLVGAVLSAMGVIHQERMDLSFSSFTGGAGEFGTSACSFAIGYSSLMALCGALALAQAAGWSRVPPAEADEQATAEEQAVAMSRVTSDKSSLHARVMGGAPQGVAAKGQQGDSDEETETPASRGDIA